MGFNTDDWYNKINDGEVVLAYKGVITSELITNVLEVVENKLEGLSEKPKITKKLYHVMVECLQNLFHHTDNLPSGNGSATFNEKFAMFVVAKAGDKYKITTGNYVSNSKIQLLKDRIDQINSLSPDELKSLYKLILSNEEFSDKGGGGLGMIDIARRTENKLEYDFHFFSNDYSFYSFQVNVA